MGKINNLDELRLMNKTILNGNDATNKQVSLTVWAHQLLSDIAEQGNRRMSQGVVAYEALLFSREKFEDVITDYENSIDEKLEDRDIDPCKVNSVKSTTNTEIKKGFVNRVYELNEERDKEKDPYGVQERVKIWIPPVIEEQADFCRGWGSKVEDALLEATTSAYRDRQDRIECKKQLLRYLSDKRFAVEHPVADAIIKNQTNTFSIPRQLLLRFSDDMPWHERDDLTIHDITEMQDKEKRLKQSEWDKRFHAFRTAHLNHSSNLVRKGAKKLFCDCWDLQSDKQKNKRFNEYIKKFDIEFKHPIVLSGFNGNNLEELSEEVYTDEDEAIFLNEIFKYLEDEESMSKLDVCDVSRITSNADIIDADPNNDFSEAFKETIEKITELDKTQGIDRFKFADKDGIYLSSYIEA